MASTKSENTSWGPDRLINRVRVDRAAVGLNLVNLIFKHKMLGWLEENAATLIAAAIALPIIRYIYWFLCEPLDMFRSFEEVGYSNVKGQRQRTKKDLINRMRRNRGLGRMPPPFPNGWYVIIESAHVSKEGERSKIPTFVSYFRVTCCSRIAVASGRREIHPSPGQALCGVQGPEFGEGLRDGRLLSPSRRQPRREPLDPSQGRLHRVPLPQVEV